MSLAIDVDDVTAVLLADGWHEVANRSFELDAYEYLWSGMVDVTVEGLRQGRGEFGGDRKPLVVHAGGNSGICATGFAFTEKGQDGPVQIAGPLTSILAIRCE